MDESERQWTIGEIAGVAGVTVRTLRHYDQLGLLEPAERSHGGHRRYAVSDVQRLYRILALRRLGFSLAEIGGLVDAEVGSLREATRSHTMEAMAMTVKLTRIYTRQGDAGETRLADMTRVAKTDPVIEASGDLDELNAHLGLALAAPGLPERFEDWLRRIQNDLFDIGAELSAGPDSPRESRPPRVTQEYVAWLEEACDEVNGTLEPLESFVLPGGDPCAAQLHVCRTVCRRAERHTLALGTLRPEVARYLNRLSDLLFILARAAVTGAEPLWEPGRQVA